MPATKKTDSTSAELAVTVAETELKLRDLYAKRTQNREDYHAASERSDVDAMRRLRNELADLAGQIQDLERILEGERAIAADVRRVESSRAERAARAQALQRTRQFVRSRSAAAKRCIAALVEAAKAWREVVATSDQARQAALGIDRTNRSGLEHFDLQLGLAVPIGNMFRDLAVDCANPNIADDRWLAQAQQQGQHYVQEYEQQAARAIAAAERLLPEDGEPLESAQ